MKFAISAIVIVVLWIAWLGGYIYPRVALHTYHDIEIKGSNIRHYTWWAVSVYDHGDSGTVATFSENQGQTYAQALEVYYKTKASFH